jgi:hypothetical protein
MSFFLFRVSKIIFETIKVFFLFSRRSLLFPFNVVSVIFNQLHRYFNQYSSLRFGSYLLESM